MTGLIIFIIGSIICLVALLYLSSKFNESKGLFWAMLLLIGISVCSGRWHRHYIPHWKQAEFEQTLNTASSANNKLKAQITEYNHHNNGTAGHFSWKHKVQSKPNLATAQDNVISDTKKLLNFKTKITFDPGYDNQARKPVERQAIQQLNRHRYVGQGYKTDHTLSND